MNLKKLIHAPEAIPLLLLGIGVALSGIYPGILLAVSVLLYALLLQRRFFIVFTFGLILSVVSYATAGALLMHLLYVVAIPINFSVVYILLSLPLFVVLLKATDWPLRLSFSWSDITHTLFIIVAAMVLMGPLIGASPSKTIEFLRLGGTEDTSSQMQMYHYILKERKFAYNNTYENTGIRESLTSYPQGSHAAAAVVTHSFMPDSATSKYSIVIGYGASLAGMYIAMFYLLFAMVSHYMMAAKKTTASLAIEVGLAVAVMLIGVLGVSLGLFVHSFMGQVAAYLGLVVIFTYLSLSNGLEVSNKEKSNPHLAFLGLILGFFLVFTSWYIIAPIAAIPCLAFLVNNFKWVRRNLVLVYVVTSLLTLALLCVYLTYIYLFTSTDAGHILTPAGVDRLSPYHFLLAAPVLVLSIFYFKQKKWFELTVALSIIAAAIFAALIGAYQVKKIGHLEYYFFKSIYTFLFIGMILVFYEASMYLKLFIKLPKLNSARLFANVLMLVVLLGASLPALSKPVSDYVQMKYGVKEVDRTRLLDLTLEDNRQYADVLFVGSCDRYLNFLGTIWSGSLNLDYLRGRNKLENALLYENQPKLTDRLVRYGQDTDEKIKAYVIGVCDPELVDSLSRDDSYVMDTKHRSIQP